MIDGAQHACDPQTKIMNRISLDTINAVSHVRSLIAKNNVERRLARLGIRLHFVRLPDGWIQAAHPVDLTPTLEDAGLPLSGVGYSTIGGLVQDRRSSTRFWPTSPFYQAWLGAYLLQTPRDYGRQSGGEPDAVALMQPALAVQRAWLHVYGCPDPQAELKPDSFHLLEKCTHQDYPAYYYQGDILTQCDIGAGNRYQNGYFLYRTYELMFQRFGGIHLPSLCTLPPVWPLPGYHPLELEATGLMIPLEGRGQWVIFYFLGTSWGGNRDFATVKANALAAMSLARIISN